MNTCGQLNKSIGASAVLICLLCLVPRVARAAPIAIDFSLHAQFSNVLMADSFESYATVELSCYVAPTPCATFSGEMLITSSNLQRLTITYDGQGKPLTSFYEYAPGNVLIDAHWTMPDGSTHSGKFTAPVPDVSFVIEEQAFMFGPEICCDREFLFGPGLFDHEFASLLGVDPISLGGSSLFVVDGINPVLDYRQGAYNFGSLQVTANTVPAPGLPAMLSVGVAGLLWRRRATTRAQRNRLG
jgi:hypothetical protein